MKVLLVDADSKEGFPNLALMKLSRYYKTKKHKVTLIRGLPSTAPLEKYDRVFISCIYFQNRERVLDYAKQFRNVQIGGSGYDLHSTLPSMIEHLMPDYSLYDDVDFSMGFTSRGCIRHCGFCIVPEKEGAIQDNAPIEEFWWPLHSKLVLLDNNFQASPEWERNIRFIIDRDLKVNFNQGLDIRLMTPEFAAVLAATKYYSFNFKTRGFHIAFDTMNIKAVFLKGVSILIDAGIRADHIMVYILVGYNTTHEQDLKRIEIVIEQGAKPYIMRYNQTKDRECMDLARWVNRKYYEFIPYGEYKR